MTLHERLEAFWAGERPDQIPYTIYHYEWRHTKEDPAWDAMFEAGLGVTCPVGACKAQERAVERAVTTEVVDGVSIRKQTVQTSEGAIWQTWKDGWHDQYLLKTAEDYRVMTNIVRNTTLLPNYEKVESHSMTIGPYGVQWLSIGRTPLQTILVDFAGLENFAFHLVDFEEEVRELFDAMLEKFRQTVEITSKAPGRFVSNLENFTAESLGPDRFAEFLLPVYEECFPMLHDAGKIVGYHYDGHTACCKDVIAKAPIDVIESLTEPNEGDQTLSEARAVWPDKLFWCNIRVGDYNLPPAELRAKVLSLVEQGSVHGKCFAFEVSEQYPHNWRESIPIVLDALRDTQT